MLHRLNGIIKSKIKSIVHEHNRMEISMNMDERVAMRAHTRDRKPSIIFDLSKWKGMREGEGGRRRRWRNWQVNRKIIGRAQLA